MDTKLLELLTTRRAELQAERDRAIAQANAIMGALQEVERLIALMQANEEKGKVEEEKPDAT